MQDRQKEFKLSDNTLKIGLFRGGWMGITSMLLTFAPKDSLLFTFSLGIGIALTFESMLANELKEGCKENDIENQGFKASEFHQNAPNKKGGSNGH